MQDLQLSYRPADLRSCIDRAYTERARSCSRTSNGPPAPARPATSTSTSSRSRRRRVAARAPASPSSTPPPAKRIADEHERATRELETAYEELQSTNEELETTNEELQSTIEELETTSEELQSTNEELETMNEELQSTNEELETVNEELRRRSEELKRVNTFLESILASLRGGVVVVDPDFLVLVWNRAGGGPLGPAVRRGPGPNLLNLDIGLPVERLKPALRACLSGEASLPGDRPRGDQPPGQGHPLPRHLHADDRRRRRQAGSSW